MSILNRDREYKITDIRLLKMKITVSEMKNAVGLIVDIAGEKINEPEDTTIETSKIKHRKQIKNRNT